MTDRDGLHLSLIEHIVPNCDPPIPSLPDLVRQLNFDRDLFAFIKRGAYIVSLLLFAP